MLFFSIYVVLRRKITKLSRKNRFRTVASPGACERLAVLSIDASRQYILLVIIIIMSSSSSSSSSY